MSLNILFCGLGSIGIQHAKLLEEHFNHDLYALRTFKGQEQNDLKIKELRSWDEVDKYHFDVAFITNPTDFHIEYAIECARRGISLFIEKPIGCSEENINDLLKLVKDKKLTAYVAYPLRFHPVLKKLKSLIDGSSILHSRIVCGSYLPSWRPNQKHSESYSAHKNRGGGVILDLSHELDYSSYLFGEVRSITGLSGKKSDITFDSDDYADMLVLHERCVSNIHLNYFSRKKQRNITIDTHNACIEADLVMNYISFSSPDKSWNEKYSVEMDDVYLQQLNYFFENISNPQINNNLFEAVHLFKKIIEFKRQPWIS